jgi:predicted patatin/cPLA2 family phospholipase
MKKKLDSVTFPGGGIRIFYQFGVAIRLREQYFLNTTHIYGASCGAITAVLLRSGVCFHTAMQLAWKLTVEDNIMRKKIGLVGTWGKIIEKWLLKLLPENAYLVCCNYVHLQLQTLVLKPELCSHFRSNEHLIQVIMASCHIPYILDGKLYRSVIGSVKKYIDGYIFQNIPFRDAYTLVVAFPACFSTNQAFISFKMINYKTAKGYMKLGLQCNVEQLPLIGHEKIQNKHSIRKDLFRFIICFLAMITGLITSFRQKYC